MRRNCWSRHLRQRHGGFTLMELVVAMVIVAILAAIALPSYQNYVRKSRRSSAKSALLDLASREEQYFATKNVYASNLSELGYANAANNAVQIPSTTEDYYNVQLAVGNPATTFQATATPQTSQIGDACGTYQLTDTGAQTVNGTNNNCW
jgi:type IV pilus assembly protein PilE